MCGALSSKASQGGGRDTRGRKDTKAQARGCRGDGCWQHLFHRYIPAHLTCSGTQTQGPIHSGHIYTLHILSTFPKGYFSPPDLVVTMQRGISYSLEEAFLIRNTATMHKPACKGHQTNLEAKTSPEKHPQGEPQRHPHPVSLGWHLLTSPATPGTTGRARAAACQAPMTQGTDTG